MSLKLKTVNLCGGSGPEVSEMEYHTKPVPMPKIKRKHWKVGDGMNSNPRFIIAQIAVVQVGKDLFEILYYDEDGDIRGDQKVRLEK